MEQALREELHRERLKFKQEISKMEGERDRMGHAAREVEGGGGDTRRKRFSDCLRNNDLL
eukprot:518187-Hanusia_phi.AAC.1